MHQPLPPERAVARAKSLEKRGEADAARSILIDTAKRFPQNLRVRKALKTLDVPKVAPRPAPLAAKVRELGLLVKAERNEVAVALASDLLEVLPGDPIVLTCLGAALHAQKKYLDAAGCFEAAIRAAPTFSRAWAGFGASLDKLQRHHQAVQALNQALALSPFDTEALGALGSALRSLNRHEDAYRCFLELIAIKDSHKVRLNCGTTLIELGRAEEAKEHLAIALAEKPDYCLAHRCMTMVRKYTPGDEHLATMNALAAREDLSDDERVHLNFGRGKAFDDVGERAGAFAAWSEANALRQRQIGYSAEQERQRFAIITQLFRDYELTPLSFSPIPYRPVFVVGMPRSGTSLCEQILDRHPAVWGAGELEEIHRAVAKSAEANGRRLSHDMVRDIRAYYLNVLKEIGAPPGVVVDKMPQNFRFAGFIRLAFPEAKIIHMRREPAAVCWSLFKSYFSIKGHGYAYDLMDAADYYKMYQAIMDLFEGLWPNTIFRMDYEALTEDPEGNVRKILAECELPFDPACLEAHRSTRAVRTVSALQVRKAIYKGSSDEWRKYEEFLGPLLQRLAEHGLAPEPAAITNAA